MKGKFVIGAVLLSLLFTFILSGVMVGVAGDLPSVPHKFWGNVTLNGTDAPNGTVINATIDGEFRGNVTVITEGQYGEYLAVDGSASDDGKMIIFSVDGIEATEIAVWYSMAPPTKLDLTAGEAITTCGDINGDTVVDIEDVMLLFDHVGNHQVYDPARDVNCDSVINMGDVILLLNHVLGGYELGCCE